VYDVIVVGAGPAGSTTARLCAKMGLNTLLLDKKRFPREKLCGGGLTRAAINELRVTGLEIPPDIIEETAYVFRAFSGKHRIEVTFEEPFCYLVKREAFDFYLLNQAHSELTGPKSVGTGIARENDIELSRLIDILNERFGTEFKPADQLFFDSIREDAVANSNLRQSALVNTQENFGYVLRRVSDDLFIDRMEQNEEIVSKYMNDPEFRETVIRQLIEEVYEQIRGEENIAN
jgi:hypothetical protein